LRLDALAAALALVDEERRPLKLGVEQGRTIDETLNYRLRTANDLAFSDGAPTSSAATFV
jgi:hypothetical protein